MPSKLESNKLFNIENKNFNLETLFIVLFAILTLSLIIAQLKEVSMVCDEFFHFDQIGRIERGEGMVPALTVIPGYHYLISYVMQLFHLTELHHARYVSLFFSLVSVGLGYGILKSFNDQQPTIKTALIFTSPLLFPFFFFVYTDILALTFVLGSFYLCLQRKYHWAGLVGILSVLIRQTNILWIFLIYLFVILEHFKDGFSVSSLKSLIVPSLSFGLCGLLFVGFVVWNDGIALGDKSMHPAFELSLGNLIFFLFCFFILMLPHCLMSIKQVVQTINQSQYLWLVGLGVFLVIYFNCTFSHYYNTKPLFLRNVVLITVQTSIVFKIVFSVCSTFSFLVLVCSPLRTKGSYLLYPIFMLLISSSSLIEQRYYIIGFVFIVLFIKELKSPRLQLMYGAMFSAIIWSIVSTGDVFL